MDPPTHTPPSHTLAYTHMQTHKHTHTHVHTSPGWLVVLKGAISSPYPPCDIVMPHFSQHKKDDDSWYSHPFFSSPGGYKLCLSVYANGHHDGKGTHISIFVRLMKGKNDDKLQWPFEHNVTYAILNWKRDENHVINTTQFKDASSQTKSLVTSGERAFVGPGKVRFLSHALLYGSRDERVQYLHEDCLCWRVLKVEPLK